MDPSCVDKRNTHALSLTHRYRLHALDEDIRIYFQALNPGTLIVFACS